MSFIYIVSDQLDYNKLICNDAGPQYAKSMGWDFVKLSNIKLLTASNVYIIDNRITQPETLKLTEFITSNTNVKFIIKVVDPYFENSNHFFYIWLNRIALLKNVYLLSVYEPREQTLLLSKVGYNSIIYAPYPYDLKKEISLKKIGRRNNKVIISGSINNHIYPFRTSIWRISRRGLSRALFDVLKHPGYAEMSDQPFNHFYTGDNFIKYLANYKYMLVCGSRCEIELLKFHECAYAGCLPIGIPPTSFPKEIRDLFISPNKNHLFFSTLKIIFNWKKVVHEQKISLYRKYLQTNRSAAEINISILNQLVN